MSNERRLHNSSTLRYTGKSSAYTMSLLRTDVALHICQAFLAMKSVEAILNHGVRIWDTGSVIHGTASAFAVIRLKFMGSWEFPVYVFSHVMTDPAQQICRSHLAIRQSRQYCVLWSEYETQLTYWWHCHSICRHMIDVQMCQRVLGTYHYDWSITAYLTIPAGNEDSLDKMSTCVIIWDTGSPIHGKAAVVVGIWPKFQCTGKSWAFRNDRSSTVYLPIWFGNKDSLGNIV